jgi:hypothetical protein
MFTDMRVLSSTAVVLAGALALSGCAVEADKAPLGDPPAGNQVGEVDPPPSPVKKNDQGMRELNYGLVWSFTSQQMGLGNVSDPALLQLPDGTLRLFFKNGNEPQMGLTGFDNKIHSFVSDNGGVSWSLEEGVRIDVNSSVSIGTEPDGGYSAWGWVPDREGDALTQFQSQDGRDFTPVGGTVVDPSTCVNISGKPAEFLGDPQVVRLDTGFVAYAHDLAAGQNPPFTRPACRLVSPDGISWEIDAAGTFAFEYDIQSNPELYKNLTGELELWFPVDRNIQKITEIRTSSDGVTWTEHEGLSWMASDPDRLDLSDGRKLLAFGGFDQRAGGLLALAEQIESPYSASRSETFDSTEWRILGADPSEIQARNLCTDIDETANLDISENGDGLQVVYQSGTEGPGSTSCVFLLIGDTKALT